MAATSTGTKKKPCLDLADSRPAPHSPLGTLSGMDQFHPQMTTNAQAINANNSHIYNNCTINQNFAPRNQAGHSQRPVPDESKLAFIMENCEGKTVDVKVEVCKIEEPEGMKRRSKVQFRGSFKVADETAHTTLKVFGPHKKETLALFRPNHTLILRKVKVNPGFLNFTSYSTVTKSTVRIQVADATRSQMEDEEESDLMTPEQITLYPGIAKTKVFVEKVHQNEERTPRKKGRGNTTQYSMRRLTVKGRKDSMQSFTLILFGRIADEYYEEGKSYVFTKVEYNKKYENLKTVVNCKAVRCPDD